MSKTKPEMNFEEALSADINRLELLLIIGKLMIYENHFKKAR
ncbi:hypothetical protein [Nitrosomonas aestuarii]|nr:hypothetical protein [Nitrosomonas aestuarii]PTN12048.1 hypothetical protein C8R11_1059 [Nitrosomonas aestuarii]